ncbi:MAG: hypothetical protein IBJ03_18530 [Gemmatimonadaceae bacterium]|nr:hypothetical protein [Gemmatimonadaceae bacterium]
MKRRTIALGLALFASPALALSQDIGAGAIVLAANHDVFNRPLSGGALHVFFPRKGQGYALGIVMERVGRTDHRIGSTCVGLVMPGTCPSEPLTEDKRLTDVRGMAIVDLFRGTRASVALSAGGTIAKVAVNARGQTSGGTRQVARTLFGADVGIVANWRPLKRVPVLVEAAGEGGRLRPLRSNEHIDGYTPFERAFNLNRYRIGIVWRL